MKTEQPPQNAGSNPAARTIQPLDNQELEEPGETGRTDSAQKTAPEPRKMKFPQTIRHRKSEAKVYGKSAGNETYRVVWKAGGKRLVKHFAKYGEAKEFAEAKVRELAQGSQAASLSAKEAAECQTALEILRGFHAESGRQESLSGAVASFVEASRRLGPDHSLMAAVNGFLSTVATVRRTDLGEAVEEFLAGVEKRTKAPAGARPERSPKYYRHLKASLQRFSATFQNHAVSDLTKQHLALFMDGMEEFAPKSRNHVRVTVKQFLRWCVRREYLAEQHRLFECEQMSPERAGVEEIEFYSPDELRALIEAAEGPMRAVIALQGLSGLRVDEVLRAEWRDIFDIPGEIAVTRAIAKTRRRRLVSIVPSLAEWLEPFRKNAGLVYPGDGDRESHLQRQLTAVCERAGVERKDNGLRHGYVSFLLAQTQNENYVAAQAGNSPQVIHANYKGLATKSEAEKWFGVRPAEQTNVIPFAKEGQV